MKIMGIIGNINKWIKSKFARDKGYKEMHEFAIDNWHQFKSKHVKINKRYRTVYDIYLVTKWSDGRITRIKVGSHKSLGYILNYYGVHADKISQETIVRSRK